MITTEYHFDSILRL